MEGACCQRVTNRCMVVGAAGLREAKGMEYCGREPSAQQLCHLIRALFTRHAVQAWLAG